MIEIVFLPRRRPDSDVVVVQSSQTSVHRPCTAQRPRQRPRRAPSLPAHHANTIQVHNHHHHHQFNTHEYSMNNKIHDRTHTITQKDTKRQITQTKLIQKNKTRIKPKTVLIIRATLERTTLRDYTVPKKRNSVCV